MSLHSDIIEKYKPNGIINPYTHFREHKWAKQTVVIKVA